uniref:DUF2971 domain-containing protein n=1 Tax=Plectus sambesii TaxID=2011161 RepID=A0A914UUV2_9BILA
MRLMGMPWVSENDEGMDARRFILQMLHELQEIGWFLYNTANVKGTADCMFFIRHPNGEDGWDEKSDFSMISLNNNDRLRLIDCDEKMPARFRKCIDTHWGKGLIQREGQFHGAYEFKFKGEPWCADAQDVVYSRYLIVKVIEMLRKHGWEFYHAVDMTRKLNDKAVMIFRKSTPKEVIHWALAPAEVDKLRVIGAPNSVIETVRKFIQHYYPNGITSENPNFYSCHEFKMKGMPWYEFAASKK